MLLLSCGSAPKMQKKITLWVGAPEYAGICKASLTSVAKWANLPPQLVSQVLKNTEAYECIPATDNRFKEFACKTWDDEGIQAKYIETLINSCAKWK